MSHLVVITSNILYGWPICSTVAQWLCAIVCRRACFSGDKLHACISSIFSLLSNKLYNTMNEWVVNGITLESIYPFCRRVWCENVCQALLGTLLYDPLSYWSMPKHCLHNIISLMTMNKRESYLLFNEYRRVRRGRFKNGIERSENKHRLSLFQLFSLCMNMNHVIDISFCTWMIASSAYIVLHAHNKPERIIQFQIITMG